jgi:hypothetical protein
MTCRRLILRQVASVAMVANVASVAIWWLLQRQASHHCQASTSATSGFNTSRIFMQISGDVAYLLIS